MQYSSLQHSAIQLSTAQCDAVQQRRHSWSSVLTGSLLVRAHGLLAEGGHIWMESVIWYVMTNGNDLLGTFFWFKYIYIYKYIFNLFKLLRYTFVTKVYCVHNYREGLIAKMIGQGLIYVSLLYSYFYWPIWQEHLILTKIHSKTFPNPLYI